MSFLSQIRFCFIPVALSTYPTKIDLMKFKKPTGRHIGPTSQLFWYEPFWYNDVTLVQKCFLRTYYFRLQKNRQI